ncbi:PREDICTED: uncharacterized protein LOC105316597 isoform X1 [Amphimedon queenslandica]|uniref:Uncharacterized protein n=1 Tax=Amphimedon queenslandica TaxID=400682 RepID=A0AAN0J506_AMPQE|nr:PREDICTED: uncharacterized protein LOC105316597 isoform X1 [Amphimedon queenslandica]|eukprot:XP_019851827.1 PREDICTED: uncharacterized protein LOC105316597 isoform X1 [Amphimedon queenslandica]
MASNLVKDVAEENKLVVVNLYNNIKPGDTTHEDIHLKYKEYFTKFSKRMKIFIQPVDALVQQLPCYILQVTYYICQKHLLSGALMDLFCENVKNYEIPEKIKQVACDDRDSNLISLSQLFSIKKINENEWELLKAGFGVYLYVCEAKCQDPLIRITNEVLEVVPKNIPLSQDKIKEMVDKAVCLVWDMVTIVPPAIVYQPTEYDEEWHEKRITSWKDNLPYNPVVYFQPVLFYSALGHVGCKGTIGNTQPNNITLIQCHCLPQTELHKPLESIQVTNASSKDTASTIKADSGNFQSSQQTLVDEKSGGATKFDGCYTFTSADEDLASLLPYLSSVYLRKQSVDEALPSIQDSKDEAVDTSQCSNSVGMTVSQNTLLSNSKDVDKNFDNSDDRNALAIVPNKDNSDSEENSTNDNLVSDKVTPICDRPDGDVIHSPWLNNEELSDNNLLLLEVNRLCHNINIGDITHESVCLTFNEYFVMFNRQFKQLVHSQDPVQSVICLVVQTAYKLCVEYILEGPVMKKFNDSPDSILNQLPKAVKEILSSRNKLETLFVPCAIKNGDHWELLKISYSYLLCISKAKSLCPFAEIQNQVLAIVSDQIEEPIQKLIEKAVHVTWDMVTLVPPAIVAQPPDINEEWHEIRTTYWNDSTHNPLIYFKPVLFYSALGQVACKGEVGNVLRSNAVVLHHQEHETKSQQSSENISHEAFPVPDLSIMLNEADDEISNRVEKTELQLKVFHSVSIKTNPPAKILYAPEYEVTWRSCSNCGTNAMISDRSTCEHCNNSAPDYLAWSILTLLCCFWPFSILALVYSMETRHHNASSNYKRASKSSKMAMIYNYFSFFTGILLIIILTMSVAAFLVYCALY